MHNILRLTGEVVTDGVCSSALVEKSENLCAYTPGIEEVGKAANRHVGVGEASAQCTRISPMFRSRRYDASGGQGKIASSGSEDNVKL